MCSDNLCGSKMENLIENGTFISQVERPNSSLPTVIVIGGGISGLAAARRLHDASFKVILLESRDRLGGRIHTDHSFGYPVDLGASWLHGVCNENPLAPLIRGLGLKLYRTSGDNSVLYDHDLESYTLFDKEGRQVPQQMVIEVGDTFKRILEEVDLLTNFCDVNPSFKLTFFEKTVSKGLFFLFLHLFLAKCSFQ